jgi:asparagine synthase (glutamine-hydrolysing)
VLRPPAATPTAPVWTYLDPARLRERLDRRVTDRATRAGIDFALNLDVWLCMLRPTANRN